MTADVGADCAIDMDASARVHITRAEWKIAVLCTFKCMSSKCMSKSLRGDRVEREIEKAIAPSITPKAIAASRES